MAVLTALAPARSRRRSLLTVCVLAASLLGARTVEAGQPEPEEEVRGEEAPGEEVPGEEVPGEEGTERELPTWMFERNPSAAERLASLTEVEFEAFLSRMQADFESASDEDKAVLALVSEQIEREFDNELEFQTGDVELSSGLATLHLSEDYRFIGAEASRRVLVDGWGNPPSAASGVLGMIFPAGVRVLEEDSWGVILTFSEDGYVDDDDAEDLDYDEVYEALKKGSVEEDRQRVAQGYSAMPLVGWAEPPHYDEDKHALYWALTYQPADSPEQSLNFAIRVLGRRGVLELNGVASKRQLAMLKPAMEEVYGMVEYNPGHRYTDFDPDLDKVAAYGLGGLILGKIAMKAGLFAGLLKILVAGKKFIVLGGIGLVAIFRRFIGREKSTEETSED